MSKRRALNQLTKEDYEREESEGEEMPVPVPSEDISFQASREVMERRSVIKAKRRTTEPIAGSSTGTPMASPFVGINLVPSASGATSSFLSNSSKPGGLFGGPSSSTFNTTSSFGLGNQQASYKFGASNTGQSSATQVSVKFGLPAASSTAPSSVPFSFGSPSKQTASFASPTKQPPSSGLSFNTSPKAATQTAAQPIVNGTTGNGNDKSEDKNPEFYSKLKKLNHDFIRSLQPHLDFGGALDFSPLCNEYLKHLKSLEETYLKKPTSSGAWSSVDSVAPPKAVTPPAPPPSNNATFGSFNSSVQQKSSPVLAPFSSGPSSSPSKPLTFGPAPTKPSFGLSVSATPFIPSSTATKTEPVTKPFSFGIPAGTSSATSTAPKAESEAPKPFSFGVSTGTTSTASTASSFSGSVSSTASTGFSFSAAASSTPKFGSGFDPKPFSFGAATTKASVQPTTGNKPAATFSFGSSSQPSASSSSQPAPSSFASAAAATPFSFSAKPSFGSGPISSLFSSPATASTSSTPLFGSSTGPSPNFQSNVGSVSTDAGDDEPYEPPKVEDANVEEKDAIYSKKIKLFKKGDGKYESVGVGMLHVKKLENGKHQLIVRGENAIGSIWLNTILAPGVVIKKMPSKKDVSIATVVSSPPPEAGGLKNGGEEEVKTVIHLLRCTNEENADELDQKLKSFRG